MAKVAINGLGRIGRATLKIVMDTPGLDLVAANDLGAPDNVVYLLKYDTVYGRYEKPVEATDDDHLTIGEHRLTLLRERDPARLPWKSLNVDIVFECTGAFTRREDLDAHIRAGARYVILSAPSKSDDVETIVHGVNTPQGGTAIISCASCTTNCITPVMEILGRRIGVKKAIMTTVHGYTASQAIVDGPHTQARRGRAGAANLVPTSTGAAAATTRALPEYRGRFDGVAVRAPVPVGSLADIVALAARPTTVDEVNRVFTEEARERTLSRRPRRDGGSGRLVRHHQGSPRVGRGSRHDTGRRWRSDQGDELVRQRMGIFESVGPRGFADRRGDGWPIARQRWEEPGGRLPLTPKTTQARTFTGRGHDVKTHHTETTNIGGRTHRRCLRPFSNSISTRSWSSFTVNPIGIVVRTPRRSRSLTTSASS